MKLFKSVFLLLLMGFLLTSCNIKKFTMPTWDVNVNIPLLNEKYFVSDLIDSVNFFPAADNNITFQTSGELDTSPIGPIAISMDVDTGNLPLQTGNTLVDTFPLSNLQTGSEVAYGLISDGGLRVTFSSMHPSVSQVTLTLLNVLDNVGVPLTITYDGTEGGYTIPLAGYHVGTVNSDIIIEDINFEATVLSSETEGTTVGFLRLGMTDDLSFTRFRGRIPSLTMDVVDNQSHIDIEYPWGIEDAIQLQDADIMLHIESPLAYPCIIRGDFYAVNYTSGLADTISLLDNDGNPFTINPRIGNSPGLTDIQFSNDVDRLLRIMPEYIELRNASYQIDNSAGTIGELLATDMITGEYVANSPFRFTLFHSLITPKDSMKIEISDDNRDTIRKNLLSSVIQIGIVNQLPVGAETTIYFGLDPAITPDNPSTWAFSRTAHILAKSEPNIEQIIPLSLSHDELLLFTNPRVYLKQTFIFDASDGPITITASPADYIQVRSMMNVEIHVEEQ